MYINTIVQRTNYKLHLILPDYSIPTYQLPVEAPSTSQTLAKVAAVPP